MSIQQHFFFLPPYPIFEGGGAVNLILSSFFGPCLLALVLIPLPLTSPRLIVSSKSKNSYLKAVEISRQCFYFILLNIACTRRNRWFSQILPKTFWSDEAEAQNYQSYQTYFALTNKAH